MPQIDFHDDVIDTMMSDVFGSIPSLVGDAAQKFEEAVSYNDEQARNAYHHVFKLLRVLEKGGDDQVWRPEKTGLSLQPAPPGKGRSMWVSEAGREKFERLGEDALRMNSKDFIPW